MVCILFFFLMIRRPPRSTLFSLHDALPISRLVRVGRTSMTIDVEVRAEGRMSENARQTSRSEEHTSELQSRLHLVCRLLLEKKKNSVRRTQQTQHNRLCPHSCLRPSDPHRS